MLNRHNTCYYHLYVLTLYCKSTEMNTNTLNDFIWNVRRNNRHLKFPLPGQEQHNTIFIRAYNNELNEEKSEFNEIENELSLLSRINEICSVLKNEDLPRNKQLEEYINNLSRIFTSYSTDDHNPERFLTKVLAYLHGFLSFVRLSNQRDEELLIHLQSLVSVEDGKIDVLEFTPERASFYLNCKERYNRELQNYFSIFHDFLLKESDKSKGLKVTTRTEQCLVTLTDLIQQSLQPSESAMILLSEFRRKLWMAQRQAEEN
jgi:hypothetical protein